MQTNLITDAKPKNIQNFKYDFINIGRQIFDRYCLKLVETSLKWFGEICFQIYKWIRENFAYYRNVDRSWQVNIIISTRGLKQAIYGPHDNRLIIFKPKNSWMSLVLRIEKWFLETV